MSCFEGSLRDDKMWVSIAGEKVFGIRIRSSWLKLLIFKYGTEKKE